MVNDTRNLLLDLYFEINLLLSFRDLFPACSRMPDFSPQTQSAAIVTYSVNLTCAFFFFFFFFIQYSILLWEICLFHRTYRCFNVPK